MGRKSQRIRTTKSIPGWTAEDQRLAECRLAIWEAREIMPTEDWVRSFPYAVNRVYSGQTIPGGLPPGPETLAQIEIQKSWERLHERVFHLGNKAKKLFEIGCDILEKKGGQKTPEFVRGIYEEGTLPMIQSEKRAILADFQQYCPVGKKGSVLEAQKHLDGVVSRLEIKWNRIIQREALKVEAELLESRMQAQSSAVPATEGPAIAPDAKSAAAAKANARQGFVMPILKKKGWSKLDWASESKVDYHTADDYMKGKTNPYLSTRRKLADALGVSVEELPQ